MVSVSAWLVVCGFVVLGGAREVRAAPSRAATDGASALREVVVENLDTGDEVVVRAVAGGVVAIVESERVSKQWRFAYHLPYRGESRLRVRMTDDTLEVNGRVVGLRLRGGRVPPEFLARYRGQIEAFVLEVAPKRTLDARAVAGIRALAGERVAIDVDAGGHWVRAEIPAGFERLGTLKERLVHLGVRAGGMSHQASRAVASLGALRSLEVHVPFEQAAELLRHAGDLRGLEAVALHLDAGSFEETAVDSPALPFSVWWPGLVQLRLSGMWFDAEVLREVPKLPRLEALDLASWVFDEAEVDAIAGAVGLRALSIDASESATEGLERLGVLKALEVLELRGTSLDDAALVAIAGMARLRVLDLARTQVSDAGLRRIAGLQRVESLDVTGTAVGDEGLKAIVGWRRLRRLSLASTQLTDAGVKSLAALRTLERLDLSETAVTDEGLARLANAKGLLAVGLVGTAITGPGLAVFSGMPGMKALDLSRTAVDDDGLQYIAGLAQLRRLTVGDGVGDRGMASIARLTGLEVLDLQQVTVSGQGLALLSGLSALKVLALGRVDDAGLEAVSTLPQLRVLSADAEDVTEAGFAAIAELSKLERLELWNVSDGAGGVEQLVKLKALRSLALGEAVLDSDGALAIGRLTGLRRLQVDFASDRDLKALRGLKALRVLEIWTTTLTDQGARWLRYLPALSGVYVENDSPVGAAAKARVPVNFPVPLP